MPRPKYREGLMATLIADHLSQGNISLTVEVLFSPSAVDVENNFTLKAREQFPWFFGL